MLMCRNSDDLRGAVVDVDDTDDNEGAVPRPAVEAPEVANDEGIDATPSVGAEATEPADEERLRIFASILSATGLRFSAACAVSER